MAEESINLQVLHWPTPQGKVPQGDVNSWGRLLWTRVSRIFLLCRKETKGLLEKMEDVSGSVFKMYIYLISNCYDKLIFSGACPFVRRSLRANGGGVFSLNFKHAFF